MQRIITLLIICRTFLCLPVKAQECNCTTNLDSLIKGVETNYVGFNLKTQKKTIERYRALVDTLREKSRKVMLFECHLLLVKYVNFFEDPHLKILIAKVKSPNEYYDSLRIMFAKLPIEKLELDSLIQYYNKHYIPNNLEGIWCLPEFNYKIAIVKSKERNTYKGIIIKADNFKWYNGQTKMIITGRNPYNIEFFIADHTPRMIKGKIVNDIMNLGEFGIWRKEFKGKTINSTEEKPVSYSSLSKNTSILRIESNDLSLRDTINEILGKNWKGITSKENLIIDIRNNSGGSIMTTDTLNRLFYTGPIYTDGLYLKSSDENISLYEEVLNNPEYNDDDKNDFKSLIDKMKLHLGEIIQVSDEDSIILSGIPFPKKIAIIANSRTGSAAELFTMYAKQSKKVIIVGEHTKGALDYTELGRNRNLPCPIWQYTCPMGMTGHKYIPKIDNVGIEPDLTIPSDVDWVLWTKKLLENEN